MRCLDLGRDVDVLQALDLERELVKEGCHGDRCGRKVVTEPGRLSRAVYPLAVVVVDDANRRARCGSGLSKQQAHSGVCVVYQRGALGRGQVSCGARVMQHRGSAGAPRAGGGHRGFLFDAERTRQWLLLSFRGTATIRSRSVPRILRHSAGPGCRGAGSTLDLGGWAG